MRVLRALALVILAAVVAAIATRVSANCTIHSPTTCAGGHCSAVFGSYFYSQATVFLQSATQALCSPQGTVWFHGYYLTVHGTRTDGATSPVCQWLCDGYQGDTTVRFDLSDGFPVELMDFSVE